MIKQLNKKARKLAIGVGALALVAGLGFTNNTVKADSVKNAPKATYDAKMDQDLKNHKNLQAYQNPLIAAELTTSEGQVPEAQTGVENWESLPEGTTAKWNMEPDVSKSGESYGQIIVTFPDGSASNLAVHVTIENKDDSEQAQAPVKDENDSTVDSNQAASSDTQDSVIVKDEKPVKQSTVKTSKVATVEPQSQASVIDNETAHIAGDNELPQTNANKGILSVIVGLMMVTLSLSLIVKNLIKERN